MRYTNVIDSFIWSYSRLKQFTTCKYGFLLKYIYGYKSDKKNFFSDYGSLMHKVLERFYTGEISKKEMLSCFLSAMPTSIIGKAPSEKIYANYLNKAISYLKDFQPCEENITGVEKKVFFNVSGNRFIGFIDKVSLRDDALVITDHKSHSLKPRTNRSKPTKSDAELDEYLRQLYLYSIAIEKEIGKLPDFLEFNCFKENVMILEPFSLEDFAKAKSWATNLIELIKDEDRWEPNIDFFQCKYICDMSDYCDYYSLF